MRILALALVLLALAPVAAAGAAPGRRVTVAVVGDSIVESGHLANPERDGLVPALRRELTRRGIDPGGAGFVAAHPAQLEAVAAPRTDQRLPWSYEGTWAWLTRWRPDAPVDLASWSADADARATVTARADSATVAYLRGPREGSFTFRVGRRALRIDARQPSFDAGVASLLVDKGLQTIGVSAPSDGGVGLIGVFLRRDVAPGRLQVEISAVGRGGATGGEPTPPFESAGIGLLAPNVTVLVLGTNDGIGYARSRDPAALDALRAGLVARALPRTGACLIVPPGPSSFPPEVFAAVRAAVADAAREARCTLVPVLDALSGEPALTLDTVHPSAAGYTRLARPLLDRILAAAGV